jgi:Uma2 family endonuclease
MATMPVGTALMTAEDLAALPDDHHRYDLIRGELVRMAPSGGDHGRIAIGIGARVWLFVTQHKLGAVYAAETGFTLARNPDSVLGPDVAFIREDRLPPWAEQQGFPEVAPDLVVEIVSPSDRANEVTDKVMEYLDAGVKLVWVVHPRQRIVTVYTPDRIAHILREEDELDGGDVLPGFRLLVEEIFA